MYANDHNDDVKSRGKLPQIARGDPAIVNSIIVFKGLRGIILTVKGPVTRQTESNTEIPAFAEAIDSV